MEYEIFTNSMTNINIDDNYKKEITSIILTDNIRSDTSANTISNDNKNIDNNQSNFKELRCSVQDRNVLTEISAALDNHVDETLLNEISSTTSNKFYTNDMILDKNNFVNFIFYFIYIIVIDITFVKDHIIRIDFIGCC